jgi:hypothetical protein
LFLDISRLIINNKEKVKDFNQIFITLLNKIPDKQVEVVQIEFYTTALPPLVAMFVKRKEVRMLEDNFVKDIQVEKDLASIYTH